MKLLNHIRNTSRLEARVGYAIAGAALLVLPAVVMCRDGDAAATAGLVASALFGIGYLIGAVLVGRIGGADSGSTA